jgi:hypothetical protein
MEQTPNYEFYKQALLTAPANPPKFFNPQLERVNHMTPPEEQRWWKDLGQAAASIVKKSFEGEENSVNWIGVLLGTHLSEKGYLDFMKKPNLAGVKEEINEWQKKNLEVYFDNMIIHERNMARHAFYWRQYYAVNLCLLASEEYPKTNMSEDMILDLREGFPIIQIVKSCAPKPKEVAL